MLLTPLTGIPKEEMVQPQNDALTKQKKHKREISREARKEKHDLDDPILERDIIVLLKDYWKKGAIFDLLANAPILIYFSVYGLPSEPD